MVHTFFHYVYFYASVMSTTAEAPVVMPSSTKSTAMMMSTAAEASAMMVMVLVVMFVAWLVKLATLKWSFLREPGEKRPRTVHAVSPSSPSKKRGKNRETYTHYDEKRNTNKEHQKRR